ncbi:hypothetical protein LO763_22665 [Glycomyces sp. A-F 0318]|uniref:hypothetical protein n=1 Tax=Glycomyces amatae TaxID=2881355 RepID=UPI001E60FC3C|nr:hypothetical protein [Glycomyces amatae]MCD0446423.1 hypothetical protein [Glycomyces amatae]
MIRIGNLALHVLDNTIAFVCGWPGPDATGEGVTEALDALLADCHTTQAGVARVWSGAITIEYHTDAPRPVRCDELTVQGGRAVLTPVPTPIPV